MYAKAQLQQERTGTDAVSYFSHPSVCTVLNDWGALWSRAAIPPHYQTKLGGEPPPSPPCLPFPRSALPHAYTLPHPHVCLWCLSGTGPVSGENKASGRWGNSHRKKRELWKRHRLNQREESLEGQYYHEGTGQRTTPQECAPAVQMVHVKLPHPAHHFVWKKQKESQVLHNFSKQSDWNAARASGSKRERVWIDIRLHCFCFTVRSTAILTPHLICM